MEALIGICVGIFVLGIFIGALKGDFIYTVISFGISLIVMIIGGGIIEQNERENIKIVFSENITEKQIKYLQKSYPKDIQENHFNWMKRLKKINETGDENIDTPTIPDLNINSKVQFDTNVFLYKLDLMYKSDSNGVIQTSIYVIQKNESEAYTTFIKSEHNILYDIKNIIKYNKIGILK